MRTKTGYKQRRVYPESNGRAQIDGRPIKWTEITIS